MKVKVKYLLIFCLAMPCLALGYAKISETMKCVNKDCSETISEGNAKIGYRPKDDKFLSMKKGDIVKVTAKDAGQKTHLWGGTDFLGQESEQKNIINSGGQKLIIEKQETQSRPKLTKQEILDDSVKIANNENSEKNQEKTGDIFDSNKNVIVETIKSNKQRSEVFDDNEIKTVEDVAKDTKKSQISIVENVKIVEDDLKEKEVLKKLSGSDERMNQFLNLIAPNSIKSNNLATFDKQKEIKNLAVKGSNEGIFIKDKPIDNSQFIDNNFSKQKFFSSYHDNLYIKQKSYDESVLSMNAYKNRPSSIENENTFNLKKVKSDESKQPQYIESLESEDYKEDGEWKSFEEEEEKMSAEQLEEIVKQHKALREKEMQLSTETKMKKREVKSKLSAVIDLMKVNKNELTDDLKIKNTEELREIKSDVEMLESRFKTIGEVFPPLEFTDEDNYKTCMEKLHERTASLAERQKSMFDAKRFSRDLVDAIYDIEESIKDSLEKYSEYKGKLSNYENDFKERHLNNVMILNATKEEFKERELEFDNLKLELKLKKEFLNEENIELIKKEIKNIDSILVNLNLTIVKHQKTEEEIVDEAEKLSETNLFEKVHSLQKLIKIQVNVDDLLVGIEEDAIDLKQKIKNVKTKIGLLSDSQSNDNKALEIKKKLDEIRSRKVSRSNKDEISLSALHNKYNELIQAYNKIENENNFDVGSLDFNLKSLKDYLDEQKSIKLDVEESFDELKSEKKLSEYKELLDQETAKDLEYEPIEENNLYKTISTMLHDLDEFINNYYKKSISKLFSDVDFLRSKRLENSKLDKALVKELQNKFEDLKTKCHDNKFDFDISNKEINSLLDSVEFSKRLDFQKEDVLKLSLENQILFLKEKVLDEKTAFVDYEPVSELEAFKNLFKMVEESEVVVEKQIKIKNFKHELLELNELQNKYRAEDEKVIFNLQQSLNILEENAKSKGIFANKVNSLKAEINSLLNSIKSISTKHEINDEKKSYDFQLQFYQNQILIKKKELSDYKPIKEKEAYLAIGTRLNSIESAIQKSVEESHKQQKITDLSREITSLQRETTEKAAIEPTIGSSNKEDVSSSIASSIDKEEFVKTFREIATNDDFVRNILSDIVLSKEDTTNAKENVQEVGIKKRVDWDETVETPTSLNQLDSNQLDSSKWDETISSSENKKHEKHQSDSNKNLEGNESLPSKNDHVRVAEPTTKDNSNQNLSNTDDIKNTLSSTKTESAPKVVVKEEFNENHIDNTIKMIQNSKEKSDESEEVNKNSLDKDAEKYLKSEKSNPTKVTNQSIDSKKTNTTYKRSKSSLQRRLQKSKYQLENNSETNEEKAEESVQTSTKNEKILHEMPKEDDITTTHSTSKHKDIENKIGGKTKHAIELAMSIPEDLSYVLQPFVIWWFSLLPAEYQNHFYGFSWPVVFSTVFVGLFLMFVLTCISFSSSRKRKELLQLKLVKELKEQVKLIANEKILVENKLIQSSEKIRSIDEVFENKSNETKSLQENIDKLKDELSKEKVNFSKKAQNLDDSNKELQKIKKEIEKLNVKVEKKEKSLIESRNSNNELNLKVKELTSDIKNQKILNEKEEKEKSKKESTLKETVKVNDSLKKKLEESEDKIKNLVKDKDNVEIEKEESLKKLNSVLSEKEVIQDCLIQTEAWKKALLDSEDADADDVEEKLVERIKSLFDCRKANEEISIKEKENLQLSSQIETEKKNNKKFEISVSKLEVELKSVKQKLDQEEKLKTSFENKVEAYKNLMAERDLQMQSELGQGKTELNRCINDLASKEDQTQELMRQLENYKKMHLEAKNEIDKTEKQKNKTIELYEKKAHDNWNARRDSERKLQEAKDEISILNDRLTEFKDKVAILEKISKPQTTMPMHPPLLPIEPPIAPPIAPQIPSPIDFRRGLPSNMSMDSTNAAHMRIISAPPRPPSPPRSIPPQDDLRRPPSVPPQPPMRPFDPSFRGPPSNYDGRRSRGPAQPPMMRPTPQVGDYLGSRGSPMSFQDIQLHNLRKPGDGITMTSSPNPRYDGSGPPRPPKMPMGGPPPRRSEQRSNNFYDGI